MESKLVSLDFDSVQGTICHNPTSLQIVLPQLYAVIDF
jgi:hypothetical protein